MFIPSSISPQNSILPQMEQSRLSQLSDLASPGTSKTNKQLKSLSKQFESIFVHQLLKSMRSTVQKTGLFDSHATNMYESLHDEEIAKLMTEQKGIGLADVIYRDLARLEAKVEKARSEIGISSQKINPAVNLQG
ncbi:MAG: rod-binding protein [Nitrospinales bacterium]|mgnify:FL=1|nr:rod-binding protein [Nitrospinales bacterium]|tara:strand:+ start:151 stop:555 length:405 start_codon:yes stop_codon:yes gene_type:complete